MSGYKYLNLFGRNGTFYTDSEGGEPISAGEIYFWKYWDPDRGHYYPRTLEATAYDKDGNVGLIDIHTGERIIIENNHFIEVQKASEMFI